MSQMIFEKSCKILNSCLFLSSHELYSRWGSKNCRWRMRQMFWQNGSDVKMMNSFQISIWRLPSLDMGNTFIWEGTISRAGVQAPKSFFHPFFFHSKQIWSDRIERADTGCLARSLEHAPILLPVAALTAAAAVTDGQETLYSYHPLLIGGRGALGLAIYFPLQRKVQFHELGKVQIELQQLSFSAWGHFASMTEHQELTQLLFFAT